MQVAQSPVQGEQAVVLFSGGTPQYPASQRQKVPVIPVGLAEVATHVRQVLAELQVEHSE